MPTGIRNISTLLVANRGEIAVRIMRTASAAGIRTVAVYSEADAGAAHVSFADRAVCIGPGPATQSYLLGEKIIEAALTQGADAIHPGYGFLSENGAFARSVAEAGLLFVGPSAGAIDVMGDKARSKRRMIEAGIPCIPGYEGEDQAAEHFRARADEIGFPVMVKAAAGGGGRGMRLVADPDELADAIRLASSEAENAFGSGLLILEKAIVRPRHVEIQVFADDHGNAIHLGERDCSVQRRHQKVVEEAPCPVMTAELRAEMGAAAVEAARAVDYRGAGTVEFLLDETGSFYFLEMNTRLQVEHPVTELVTGLDLVALQLAVAEGRPLGISQQDVVLDGHAIEVRLYAEDPAEDFLPSTGPVHCWIPPKGLRTDAGITSGGEISPYYDAMVAKIVAHGRTREEARRKLVDGLGRTALFGTASNRDFLIDVLSRPVFAAGEATTAFIEETYGSAGWSVEALTPTELAAAGLIAHALGQQRAVSDSAAVGLPAAVGPPTAVSPELLDWSSARDLETVLCFHDSRHGHPSSEEARRVCVRPRGAGIYQVVVDGVMDGEEIAAAIESVAQPHALLTLDGAPVKVIFWEHGDGTLFLALDSRSFAVIESAALAGGDEVAGGDGVVVAPMHGQLLEVLVKEGERVGRGDKLAILEAMKMQHEILAEVAGKVLRVVAEPGSQIAADALILEIEPDPEEG